MSKKAGLDTLQKISMSIMAVLVLMTFVGANLHALLWQSSQWLVSTVLPSVVVDLTNEERADLNESPLVRSTTLDKAAQMKAAHMAENGYFAHYSPTGVSPWHWFDEAGYVYAHAGENLAVHFTDSADVVEGWMNSPSHRANIVSGKYTEIGVGTAKGKFQGYDTVFVVQMFGAPGMASAPVVYEEPVPVTEPEPVLLANSEQEADVGEKLDKAPEVVSENIMTTKEASSTVVWNEKIKVEQEAEQTEPEMFIVDSNIEDQETFVVADEEPADPSEVVVIETPTVSTSSGLAVASIDYPSSPTHAGFTVASIATQPNTLLQLVYATLSLIVIGLLAVSIITETRRYNFHQVAYGVLLLFGMSGLLFIHQFLTMGAVIV